MVPRTVSSNSWRSDPVHCSFLQSLHSLPFRAVICRLLNTLRTRPQNFPRCVCQAHYHMLYELLSRFCLGLTLLLAAGKVHLFVYSSPLLLQLVALSYFHVHV